MQLALYCCYELSYQGFPDVEDDWECEPSLVQVRGSLEAAFEEQLRDEVTDPRTGDLDVAGRLWEMTRGGGVSLSGWALEQGTYGQAQEWAIHRSGYQLKEADPHTWCLPRLTGRAKAAMVTIQADEYGNGVASEMHCTLFAQSMRALGLDDTYGAYLDLLPAETLATTNLISLFGLHRRLRGALVGHLGLFEMTSVGPMGRYSAWLRSLGVSEAGRRFYDVHVEADEIHQYLAVDDLVGGLLDAEPDQAAAVLFGANALGLVEGRFSARLIDCWSQQRSSLRSPQLTDTLAR
ncbi:MAG: iron-containing redox enzyme family protein [Actinomycetota bacterium]|nr:iron-containing redox enzyme family protein [Actinomycetota bacterium]